MTKTLLALVLVGCSFVVGCAAEPGTEEEMGSSESAQRRLSIQCPSAKLSVERSYEIALKREADADGLDYYVAQLEAGTVTRRGVLEALVRSDEFVTLHENQSDRGFVNDLYRSFLNRTADDEGRGYWIGKLDSGTSRADVAIAMAAGDEFNDLLKNRNAACYVE